MSDLEKWKQTHPVIGFANKAIVGINNDGDVLSFDSMKQAAAYLNVHYSSISHAVSRHGKCKGYYWYLRSEIHDAQ